MLNTRRLLAILSVATGLATAGTALAQEHGHSIMNFNFAQTYGLSSCPATAPVADSCLNVTGTTTVEGIGPVSFKRVVLFNYNQYDPNHPACIPDETKGSLTLPSGTITFHAPGNVCLSDGIAAYDLIVTGGTGAYVGAQGGGQIIVPPPQTSSTGRELWHLQLFGNSR